MIAVPRRPSARAAGFTLIELLIGLTIVSLTIAILASGFYGLSRQSRAQQARFTNAESERSVYDLLRRHIKATVPLVARYRDRQALLFHGEQDSLRFVSPLPARFGDGALDVVTLALAGPGSARTLTLTAMPATAVALADPRQAGARALPLRDGVAALRFRYFGRIDSDSQPLWHDRWVDQPQLPRLIGLQFTDRNTAHPAPEVVVQLPADLEAGSAALMVMVDADAR